MAMPNNLKSQAYRHIRERLMHGGWSEGGFFSPRQIAKTIGMSYTPVREAILQLETEGLLETVGNRGVRARILSAEEMTSAFELRLVMESGAAELAAEKIGPEELEKLRTNLNEHLTVVKKFRGAARQGKVTESFLNQVSEQILVLNFNFHLTILQASCNAQLIKAIGDLHILTRFVGARVHFPGRNYLTQYVRDYRFHARIYRALLTHQTSTVRDWVKRHLTDAMQYNLAVYTAVQTASGEETEKWFYPEKLLETMQSVESHLG
jgi:DNA-binding GntR family transcriptional regulator